VTVTNREVLGVILSLLRTRDETLNGSAPTKWTETTVLFGRDAHLDSLGLVSLVADVELLLQERFGVSVNLANEHAMSLTESPFRTVRSLTDYVHALVVSNDA
jgi:acyl carrier protein